MLLGTPGVKAQNRSESPFSNFRYKTIPVTDSSKIDSLSIVPQSFSVSGVNDSLFVFYPEKSLLVWRQKPALDSVTVNYRVFPLSFSHIYSHKERSLVDSNIVSLIYRNEDYNRENFLNLNQLEYHGSYGRSISLGNNQDVALQSHFNLQAKGYILDSIKLEAALTDNTLPFQPEGTTQRLQEFDQIYIRLSKKQHFLQLGDYDLESPPGHFLKFYKRVQGAYYQTALDVNPQVKNKLGISGSVAKGQFARNIFQGVEGNQGPYKLTGNNGEQFFIVLAGTEKVFVNDVLLERGENADYIINYNTGEIRFMPRQMITKDSRIQVEFEYQDRNYLNSLIYAWNELHVSDKWRIRLDVYSNQDAKNQPYLQNLSGEQKAFLSAIGDSIEHAFYPNITTDTFAAHKILYKMVDTLVNGVFYDSVFVYSIHPDSARYTLSFSFVGQGKGNYNISATNANGRVYDWIAPVDGRPQGSFAPVQLLITPKKQQVFTLNSSYRLDSLKNLTVEIGASNTDPNLFSRIDNDAHWGMAAKLDYSEKRIFKRSDSIPEKNWNWENRISYEFVQKKFKAIAPYRNVEFARDWNIMQEEERPDEHLMSFSTRVSGLKKGTAAYDFSWFKRGGIYTGFRNMLAYDYSGEKLKAGFVANVLNSEDSFRTTRFYRPAVYSEYLFRRLGNTSLGGKWEAEHNEIRHSGKDTLLPAAFSFDIASVYLKSAEHQPAKWQLTYASRRDRAPQTTQFLQINHSHNLDLKLKFSQWKNQLIQFTGTYRKLIVDDSFQNNLKPEETLLGRLEYSANALRQAVSLNTMYEFGSGQEQKRAYTFVEVPAGQGLYTWIDYNNDGVQQANEFEVALYPDQKKFIKVYTPTNEYIRINYLNLNFSLQLEPERLWRIKPSTGIRSFLSRFSSQTALQVSNRLLAAEGLNAYNPFLKPQNDTSIILTNNALSTTVFFNRNHNRWGMDYNLLLNNSKQLLIYGVEGSQNRQHLLKIRWNFSTPFTAILNAKTGSRSYQSALQDNRSYFVHNWSGEPSLTWLWRSAFRLTASLRYEERENRKQFGGESASIQSFLLEMRYSNPASGAIQLRGQYSGIDFSGNPNDPVAFIMLDALQNGKNFLWLVNWERRVGKGIELSLEYEGRKPGNGDVIHTGRMTVRAIL